MKKNGVNKKFIFGFIYNAIIETIIDNFNCQYCNKKFDTIKNKKFHENIYCNQNPKRKNIKCFKCNKEGHYASNCYVGK